MDKRVIITWAFFTMSKYFLTFRSYYAFFFDEIEQLALAFTRKYVFLDRAVAPRDRYQPKPLSTLLSFPTTSVLVSLSLSKVRHTPRI